MVLCQCLCDDFAFFFYSLCCGQGTCSLLHRYRANRMLSRDIEDVRKVNDRCTWWGEKMKSKDGKQTQSTNKPKRPQKDKSPKSNQPSTTTEDTQKHSVHLVHKDELVRQKDQHFRSRLKDRLANVSLCSKR